MDKWHKVKCKECGFVYSSHPDLLDEGKLNGLCISCFHTYELDEKKGS